MTELPDDWAGAKLQSLHFRPLPDSGISTRYQALVEGDTAAGSPVYALTVSIATPAFRKVSEDFIASLGEMEAAFRRLPAPGRSQASSEVDTEGAPDPGTGIVIEPSLLRTSEQGIIGVAVIVLTSLGRKDHVGPHNNNHYWTARA